MLHLTLTYWGAMLAYAVLWRAPAEQHTLLVEKLDANARCPSCFHAVAGLTLLRCYVAAALRGESSCWQCNMLVVP
ncbi:hypothetical protein COO60DRAFT_924167 [Scenedesmus sp. NREL 46B-D3]|nr:hypothetical protein COO60DRAFT_924167 [Scenedesmus sp. NREL 46B-D3]